MIPALDKAITRFNKYDQQKYKIRMFEMFEVIHFHT